MSATVEIVPSVLDRIRRTLVGLKMPRAREVLDQTVRQLERDEASALEVIDTLFAEELTLRANRRVNMALRMAKLIAFFSSLPAATPIGLRRERWRLVQIENVGGAGGSIAVGRVARAAPDGYALSIGSGDQFVVNAAIYPLQYDVVKDFDPVALVSGPALIVSKTAVPASTLKELIQHPSPRFRSV
jgi:hypothetical protein